jgi:hypothetical protein
MHFILISVETPTARAQDLLLFLTLSGQKFTEEISTIAAVFMNVAIFGDIA